jgi:DNA end-binding protein Ku
MYFERAYFLMPAMESMKAYRLLAETMEKTEKVGIATFVMRDKEYLVAILSENGFLRAETLRFHDEVRSPEDVALPPIEKASAKEVQKIEKAMASMTETALNPKELKSDYTDKLLALIERKRKKGEGVVTTDALAPQAGGRSVINLMEELQRSLNANRTGKKRAGSPADEEPSKKPDTKGHPGKRSTSTKPQVGQKK